MKEKMIPEIRFEGFTDTWEQRKLGEILQIIDGDRGKNYPSSDDFLELGHTLFLSASNVTKRGFKFVNNQYISEEKSNSMGNGKVKMNDIILTSRGSIGNLALYNSDSGNKFKFLRINSGMLILRPDKFTQSSFILQSLNSQSGEKQIKLISFGSAQPQLTKKDVSNFQIQIPSAGEQIKIGDFFKQLDETITLQERKVNLLKEQKKGYLQKMFPKQNEKFPELRFEGFTDAWEERKFENNIVSIQTGTNLLGTDANEGTPLLKMGNIQRGYFSFNKLEYLDSNSNVESENIVNYGDFLFNTRNTLELVGKGATWTGMSGKYAFNSNIARFKFNGIDTIFFNYLYNTQQVISQVHARAVGTTSVAAVYPRDLNSLLYYLPSIEEQKKIGSFFNQLDNTIALQERKLETLKELKKGYLQKMFA
ncbi:restriction endonuclease subunit S [Vagococcus fluvialis]|uniref:restriction endonuclease subunit S n=1 Tax=Vagococcus fluvialis TaxID=2738 RepID=UPI001F17F6C6|nr:restriction endonuclease subunit S [Vagococcus fluvialis]